MSDDRKGWLPASRTRATCGMCQDTGQCVALLKANPLVEFTFLCDCGAGARTGISGIAMWDSSKAAHYYRPSGDELRHKTPATIAAAMLAQREKAADESPAAKPLTSSLTELAREVSVDTSAPF